MGLFSALAGVGSAVSGAIGQVAGGIGGLLSAGIGVGTQVLTGIVNPALSVVGGILPSILGSSSGAPGAQVTSPVPQPYYIPPYAGGLPGQVQYPAGVTPYAQPPIGPASYSYSLAGGPPVIPASGATIPGQVGAFAGELAMGQLSSPWKATCGGSSLGAQNHIQINPATGAMRWFGPMGKPILWSGDLAACKRVKKVGARANRAVKRGGR